MSDQFEIHMSGNAPEATRLELVADLQDLEAKYGEHLTVLNIVDFPQPTVASIKQRLDLEEPVEAAEEPAEPEVGE